MKRFLVLCMALCMCMSMLALPAQAANDGLTITIMTAEHPKYPYNTETQDVFKWIKEATGVTLEIEASPSDSYSDKKAVILGSGNLPDVIQVSQGELNDYGRLGAFVNLKDYEELLPNYMAARAKVPNIEMTEVDGAIYSFAKIGWEPMLGKTGPVIRMDVLEKNNLAVPTSYDELYAVLKALKQAYPEAYPWSARQMWSFMNEVCYNFGTVYGMGFDVDANAYAYGYLSENMKNVLTFKPRIHSARAPSLLTTPGSLVKT